jgi:hypothetical protein
MAPVLTLHQGEQEQEFAEHPTEAARRALHEAAAIESPAWRDVMLRFASTLPRRAPIRKGGE